MATRKRRRTRRTSSIVNSNPRRRRRRNAPRTWSKIYRAHYSRRRKNPSRRRRTTSTRRRTHRMANPHVVVRYRNRAGRRRRGGYRRSNPGRLGGTFTLVGGMLGGAAFTSFVSKMLPASLHGGFLGMAVNAAIAIVGGKTVGKVFKSPALGKYMQYGGLFYVGMQVLNTFFPSLSGYVPFGLNGLGLIAPSSFYTPQVNAAGAMGTFVTPAAVASAMPSRSLSGLQPGGAFNRRMGRF